MIVDVLPTSLVRERRAAWWHGARRYRGDLLGVAWILLVVCCYLSPSLKDGAGFGPTDLGNGLSLLTRLLPHLPHNSINGDTITQGVPWNTLDWQLVHHGELPLWNSLSGTGLPQMFNFESAPLSLATIAGYFVPLSASFLVTVAAKLVIAGTGVYLCCRVLGTGPLAGACAGTTFMLSGAFAGWLGWSVGGPAALGGWILAGIILAYRSRRQLRQILLLAVATAFSIYAGFPESSVLLAIGLAMVLAAAGVASLIARRGMTAIGLRRVGTGLLAGVFLAAPLLLPGVSVLSGSSREGEVAAPGIPVHLASLLLAQGFFGLPIRGSQWFGDVNYFESAAYVGVIAIVLAVLAVLVAWRRPIVVGLAASVVGAFFMIYRFGAGSAVQKVFGGVGLGSVALQRMQVVLELSVALLAGLGLDIVVRRWHQPALRLSALGASLAVAAALLVLWTRVASARMPTASATSSPSVATLESLRRSSLIWPTATIASALIVLAVSFTRRYRGHGSPLVGRMIGFTVLAAQSSFLLFAGVGINSYAHDPYPVTAPIATVKQMVGTELLGLDGGNSDCAPTAPHQGQYCGVRLWQGGGLYPEMNIAYGIDELGLHDPTIPKDYFAAWPVADANPQTPLSFFAPDVNTVALARRYGVGFVLALPGEPAPPGMRRVATVAGETLYKVPHSSQFMFAAGSGATVRSVTHPGDTRYVIDVTVPHPARLAIGITDVSGWHATAGGRSLNLERAAGDLIAVDLPAGTQTLVLHYQPARFVEGILLALATLFAVLAVAVVGRFRSRARATNPRVTT